MPKTITITNIKPLGNSGKIAEVTYTVNGQEGKAKAWVNDVDGKQGQTLDVEFEKKDNAYQGNTTQETWIKVPKPGRGGGFGGGKPDPARAENDKKRLELEGMKHEDFLRKWDRDREADAERQASIASQVVLKLAVEMAAAVGTVDAPTVQNFALDLAVTLDLTHAQIFTNAKRRSSEGNK